MYVGLFIDCVFHWSLLIIVCDDQTLFNGYYAFLKYWVGFTSEAFCACFCVGRFLTTNSNFLLQLQILFNTDQFILFISSWESLSNVNLSRNFSCVPSCWIKWHKIIHNIFLLIFLIYIESIEILPFTFLIIIGVFSNFYY